MLLQEFPSEAVKTGKADGIKLIDTTKVKVEPDSGRGSRFKMKKRIVVGNVSKYVLFLGVQRFCIYGNHFKTLFQITERMQL